MYTFGTPTLRILLGAGHDHGNSKHKSVSIVPKLKSDFYRTYIGKSDDPKNRKNCPVEINKIIGAVFVIFLNQRTIRIMFLKTDFVTHKKVAWIDGPGWPNFKKIGVF